MPDIWAFMRAVRNSNLSHPVKHVLLTLASLADPATAVIPAKYTPSLTELSRMTSLGRSTVAESLKGVDVENPDLPNGEGWVKRVQPSMKDARVNKAKTQYALQVPASAWVGLVQDVDQPEQPNPDNPDQELVQDVDGASPGAGHEVPTPTTENSPSESSPGARKPRRTKPRVADIPRPDVDEICNYLADKVEANGSKRPKITATWRRDARLLLDEKRPIQPDVARVKRLIDWSQASVFWRKNVMSMTSLREQWDRPRLDALADLDKKKKQSEPRNFEKPASTAPTSIPADQQCAKHPRYPAESCGPCRSDRLAGKPR